MHLELPPLDTGPGTFVKRLRRPTCHDRSRRHRTGKDSSRSDGVMVGRRWGPEALEGAPGPTSAQFPIVVGPWYVTSFTHCEIDGRSMVVPDLQMIRWPGAAARVAAATVL